MNEITQTLTFSITPEQQGQYLTVPFTMAEDIAEFRLTYRYPRFRDEAQVLPNGQFTPRDSINIIDLGLIAPDGRQAGASGSDKASFFINGKTATPGYFPQPLTPGEWQILAGAYRIAPEGVTVTYELTFIPKQRRLLLGDIHTHTVGSDGVLTLDELASLAQKHGLDFLAITDHNQMVSPAVLARIPGITLIPGVEWTHYCGHANFLGLEKPYDEPFFTKTNEDMQARFQSAHDRGALIVINHPQDDSCGFQFDMTKLPFDAIEIWNGPMRESNLRAVGLWHQMLIAGQKIPAVGGSDFHRENLFQILGGPCMGVYAGSDASNDILAALRAGQSFITFAPNGPTVDFSSGKATLGGTTPWQEGLMAQVSAKGLKAGDVIRLVSAAKQFDLFQAPTDGDAELTTQVPGPGFLRVEIYRSFLPGIPPLPALISNPIYFS
ncbi:PHP domain-containing protein [Chloroflexota bacterium]|nr:PHP domain-containing protein [Chloroflexota bacterium]